MVISKFTSSIDKIYGHGYEIILIGVSAGGFTVLSRLFMKLEKNKLCIPIVIVQHRRGQDGNALENHYLDHYKITINTIFDKLPIRPSSIYIAPSGYHLLVEADKSFSLSVDEPILYSRPSIDVLFRSAAEVFMDKTIGIILTGSNSDGAQGLGAVHQCGGLTIVEDPKTAYARFMPKAALEYTEVDYVLKVEEIIHFICSFTK